MGRKMRRYFKTMPKIGSAIKIAIVFILLAPAGALSEGNLHSPETDFNAAMSAYENQEYDKAYDEFSAMAEEYAEDGHNSIFRFMAAKSLYMNEEYARSDSLWDDFINEFPNSSYLQEAMLFKGHCLYKQGKLVDAASSYLSAIEMDPKSDAAAIARDNLMPLADRGLTTEQLERLIEDRPISSATEPLEFAIARRYIDAGYYRRGVIALQEFMRSYPGSHDFKQARLLMLESQKKAEGQLSIGLLAPVSGSYVEFGRSMVEGARLAINEYKDSLKIDLNIKDTGSDPIQAAKIAKEMADEEPLAVVGPLHSSAAVSAAIVLNQNDIPMITPTASEAGLAGIGPYVFQMSPSAQRIGEELARYAVGNLNINEFAIIAPDDVDGIKISNAFAEAVYRQGGEVISTTYYPAGATDFKTQIMPLHDILVAKLEEQLAEGLIDSTDYINPKTHELLDKDEWPVNLGGLFLPGYADDLKMLIPQVRYHVIRTRFLGSYSWDSAELIREVKPYIDGAVYATDFHIQPDNSTWMKFTGDYQSAFGHAPDKVAAETYDAVRMVLDGICAGNKDPVKLRDYLARIQDYRGVSAIISFRETGRANDEVSIYSIDGSKMPQ
jgi:ABC-type branched-subunit amino acid transport system substrate-binding protein